MNGAFIWCRTSPTTLSADTGDGILYVVERDEDGHTHTARVEVESSGPVVDLGEYVDETAAQAACVAHNGELREAAK